MGIPEKKIKKMRTYVIQRIKEPERHREIHISEQHFGYDPQVGRIRWHGIFCLDEPLFGLDWKDELKRIDERHRFCIRLPWATRFNKSLYEETT